MDLKNMIDKRRSTRKYKTEAVSEEILGRVKEFIAQIKPLSDDIKTRTEIVDKEHVKCILPWIGPHAVVIYSEEKQGYLENAGFILQQVDLYLQQLGLGACWLGMGRLDAYAENDRDDLKYVILITFGYPKDELRSDANQFRRKALSDISDKADERLEPARLAPSSVNSQPWYFVHVGDVLHVYCVKKGLLGGFALGDMNRIDIGIALAHMYITNPRSFRFWKEETAQRIKGYEYIGSFIIG